MNLKCELAKRICAISDANRKADKKWKKGIDAKGFTWQKAIAYPMIAPLFLVLVIPMCAISLVEALTNWARKKNSECEKSDGRMTDSVESVLPFPEAQLLIDIAKEAHKGLASGHQGRCKSKRALLALLSLIENRFAIYAQDVIRECSYREPIGTVNNPLRSAA